MSDAYAILYLIGLLERHLQRTVRAMDLYVFIRRCEAARAFPEEVSRAFTRSEHDFDASMLLLVMEVLADKELLIRDAFGYGLTPKGVEATAILPRSVGFDEFESSVSRIAA